MVESAAVKLNDIFFNQDQSLFAVTTSQGFNIYDTHPLKLSVERNLNGGIKIVEMLYKSHLIFITGTGEVPKYPPNKLMQWDDSKKIFIYYKFNLNLYKQRREKS